MSDYAVFSTVRNSFSQDPNRSTAWARALAAKLGLTALVSDSVRRSHRLRTPPGDCATSCAADQAQSV